MDETSTRRASLPKGYSYVPKGNVFITGNCRRRTQEARHTIYVVVDNEGKKQIGIGVPTAVYLQVQLDEMSTRAERASNVQKRDEAIEKEFEKAILGEFPRIPSEIVPVVLKRALEKGKGKVGRTSTLDLNKKAVLAVRAHIRHMHTDYDVLLRAGMDRDQARREVAARVHDLDGTWKLKGNRISGHTSSKGQHHGLSTTKLKATSSKQDPLPAKRLQAEMPNPMSPHQQSTDSSVRGVESSGHNRPHTNRSDANSARSVMQKLDNTHRRMILNLITQIQCTERKVRRSESRPTTEKSSGRRHRDDQNRLIKHRQAILSARNRVNELLEESGLQRVETSTELESIAKQLRLILPASTASSEILSPRGTSTSRANTRHASTQDQAEIRRKRGSGASRDANSQGRPQTKTRVVIDLTGTSDEDDVVSKDSKIATRQKHSKKLPRRDMEASRELKGKQISSPTARELRRELRELGVGDTVQALPLKRHAALEADRVLSRRLHPRSHARRADGAAN